MMHRIVCGRSLISCLFVSVAFMLSMGCAGMRGASLEEAEISRRQKLAIVKELFEGSALQDYERSEDLSTFLAMYLQANVGDFVEDEKIRSYLYNRLDGDQEWVIAELEKMALAELPTFIEKAIRERGGLARPR